MAVQHPLRLSHEASKGGVLLLDGLPVHRLTLAGRTDVIIVGIQKYGGLAAQTLESLIRLVYLCDKWPLSSPRIAAELRNDAAHEGRRVQARAVHGHRDHAGGGGLAVRAHHAHRGAAEQQLAEQRHAGTHLGARRPRRHDLGVVPLHGLGGDQHVHARQVAGSVPDTDLNTFLHQLAGQLRGSRVAARDHEAARLENTGKSAQPDAADAHQVKVGVAHRRGRDSQRQLHGWQHTWGVWQGLVWQR